MPCLKVGIGLGIGYVACWFCGATFLGLSVVEVDDTHVFLVPIASLRILWLYY